MTAVAAARLLVPIVAEPAEVDTTGDLAVEKQTDMAAVTLVAPDGTRALPVFTSMAAIAAWDDPARPVPVTAARAGQAAVSERCDVIVVDVASQHAVALRPSMVWALAQQRELAAGTRGRGRRASRGPGRARARGRRGARPVGGGARRGRPAGRARAAAGAGRPSGCSRWPPPSGSSWPPTARSGPASTGSPSRSADRRATRGRDALTPDHRSRGGGAPRLTPRCSRRCSHGGAAVRRAVATAR